MGGDSNGEEAELSCTYVSFSLLDFKRLHFRMALFVVNTEIQELKSLGFHPNGFLSGQTTCAVCIISSCFLIFCLVFSQCVFISEGYYSKFGKMSVSQVKGPI